MEISPKYEEASVDTTRDRLHLKIGGRWCVEISPKNEKVSVVSTWGRLHLKMELVCGDKPKL